MSHGHDDDAIDQAEEDILRQFLLPVLQTLHPERTIAFSWREARAAAQAPLQNPNLTPTQAQELIAQGDGIIADSCSQFAQAGYPCPPAAPGRSSSGAGRDIQPLWELIRVQLAQVASAPSSNSVAQLVQQVVPGVSPEVAEWLPWILGGLAVYMVAR